MTTINKLYRLRNLFILIGVASIFAASMLISFGILSNDLQAGSNSAPQKSTAAHSLSATGIITSTDLLAIYALAFDNDPNDPTSLSLYYTSTVNSIAKATLNAPDKTAIILADLDSLLDTHLLIAQNGHLIPVDGLPMLNPVDGTILLDDFTDEYNMADGLQLGYFLQWSRQAFSANVVTFSFLGHGAPIVPDVIPASGAPAATPIPNPTATPPFADGGLAEGKVPIPPLPARLFAHSGFTDYHSASLISIHALATALEMGTNDGADPFQTVDLVQCFASSIEELYELYPYAETFTGSPNYAYSKPEMIGTALRAISSDMTAVQIADTLIQTYDNELPAAEHPRLLVAVESSKVAAIKESWDMTSLHLSELLTQDRQATRNKITNAYDASAKYDTTLCSDPDWLLAVPDSVSDMSDFASQISTIFGPTSLAGSWALTTTQRIDDAIISRYSRNGVPWFAQSDENNINQAAESTEELAEWIFNAPGISIYTDFGATLNEKGNPVELDWFSAWYTKTANVAHLNYINPLPYSFLSAGNSNISWADVFSQYWEDVTFENVRCEPAFLAGRGNGELAVLDLMPTTSANLVIAPDSTVRLNINSASNEVELIRFSTQISTSIEAVNPQVRFNIYNGADEQIFAEAVSAGYLEAGEIKQIESAYRWPVTAPGIYTFEVILDADGRFVESDEEDNIARFSVRIKSSVTTIRLPFIAQ